MSGFLWEMAAITAMVLLVVAVQKGVEWWIRRRYERDDHEA